MMKTKEILMQIDSAIGEWKAFSDGSKHDDCSDKPEEYAVTITNRLASTIKRLAPRDTVYERNLENILSRKGHEYIHQRPLAGVLMALRREYELGYLQSVEEVIHRDTFASFLDMARHLQANGYKDPAAVIAGSTLEQHLRELCNKHQIVIEVGGKPKKADTMNAELAKAGVYSKLDQKNVTSWLGLRNDAAHGNYGNYTAQQVQLLLDSIGDFIARHPA